MKKVILSKIEYDYLLNSTFLPVNLKNIIEIAHQQPKGTYMIILSEDQSDEIRDLCGEQLQFCGFDEYYNPNADGIILENLVDKFFIER